MSGRVPNPLNQAPPSEDLRIERVVYGGFGLARRLAPEGSAALVPFSLAGELVRAVPPDARSKDWQPLQILEPSSARIQPGCPHFGACGGCHLQMASYPEQLRIKRDVLAESLARAGVHHLPDIATHSAEPWHYRNRIRLHVLQDTGTPGFGYRRRGSHEILPITTCPIAAPLLWRAAEQMLALASNHVDLSAWLRAAAEVELFCNEDASKLQLSFVCGKRAGTLAAASFDRAMSALAANLPELAGTGALVAHPQNGRPVDPLCNWGSAGLAYTVDVAGQQERFWIARGGFFQVNRFLTKPLVELVCDGRSGALAWDLFAGVGLFARPLTRSFAHVVAVEANPTAAAELAAALQRLGPHTGKQDTILNFVRGQATQRDRPDLVVLDPPRAGAGEAVCRHLAHIAPHEIVYVSCDPTTLGRDVAQLQSAGYRLDALHLVDLFPQTYHQEAVAILSRLL